MIDWNDTANERRLLLVLLNHEHRGNWDEIAKVLGPDYTAHGCRWTPDECQKLVWHILAKSDFKPGPEVFTSAAEALGGGLNANACSQKFYKLKRESETLLAEGSNCIASPSTPTSTKKPSVTPKTGASKGRKRRTVNDAEGNDDAEEIKSPSKKPRTTKKDKESKQEAEGEGDTAKDARVEKIEGNDDED
ncbi:hypothetical protein H2198_002219 [Neophaeococcomyces mojaviensis]|uniref:Uncharacterized protein n=1 Tax=Neophaeococcomyces mojaviensis TaxID=3383035 RepID=A0ACC3AF52_9EURO|nr:hypothetical protein H2198_002219 [Knufia sp. JES_112]